MHKVVFCLAFVFTNFSCVYTMSAEQLPGNFRNEDAIADVNMGKCKIANATWWGFDPNDSTETLQSAIYSGAPKVIVPFTGKDWIIRPIQLESNQEIHFQTGVVVCAKQGEFKGKEDSLFRANGMSNVTMIGYGATLRMRKADYMQSNSYAKAEWRTALNVRSCNNIKISGFTIRDTGGDGVYLGGENFNKDIVIKDIVFDNNYRQGISVIGAENLIIDNCTFLNTSGTPPSAGIDFEPNCERDRLKNCVVRNCVFRDNQGSPIQICVTQLKGKSEPVSILVENCHVANSKEYGVTIGTLSDTGVQGTIEFKDCVFENTIDAGLGMWGTPDGSLDISFVRCTWKNVSQGKPSLKLEPKNVSRGKPSRGKPSLKLEPKNVSRGKPSRGKPSLKLEPTQENKTIFVDCYLIGRAEHPFFLPDGLQKRTGINLIKE